MNDSLNAIMRHEIAKGTRGVKAADVDSAKKPKAVKTGGSASYYQVFVGNPTHLSAPYTAECNDLIESLKLTPAEANVLKAIWRQAVARMGGDYKIGADPIYDAEKSVFFSRRILSMAQYDAAKNNPNPSQP